MEIKQKLDLLMDCTKCKPALFSLVKYLSGFGLFTIVLFVCIGKLL